MKRPFALLIAILAVAVLAGCGSNGVSSSLNDAATLRYDLKGDTHTLHVSRAQLLREVRSLVNNEKFVAILRNQPTPFVITHDLKADSKLAAIWLTQLIQQAAIDDLYKTRDVHVSAAIRSRADDDAAKIFQQDDPSIFKAFDKKFIAAMTDRTARSEAVLESYTDTSDSAGQAYFRLHATQFGCASGKNVAHILVKTEAEAQAISAQLAGGASFATLAKSESTDTQSAPTGGSLGCLTPSTFVPAFQTAADAAVVGTPTAPVHTSFGYHVILVTKAPASTYDDVKTQVRQALQQEGSQKFQAAVDALNKKFKVHIDPRFGTWGHTTDAQGATTYQVTPPKAPAPATSREGTTTTTVPAAPTGSP
jgi:parvulin-like peptidyl-prolyl isomerase